MHGAFQQQDLASHELTFLNACGAGPGRAGPGRAGPGRAVRCRVILSWCGWVGDKNSRREGLERCVGAPILIEFDKRILANKRSQICIILIC